MTTLSTEEKEQFLSLKKRLKDLSKGSWLHDYCNRSFTTEKLLQQVCRKRMPDALAQRHLSPQTCCWKDLITLFENGLSPTKLDETLDTCMCKPDFKKQYWRTVKKTAMSVMLYRVKLFVVNPWSWSMQYTETTSLKHLLWHGQCQYIVYTIYHCCCLCVTVYLLNDEIKDQSASFSSSVNCQVTFRWKKIVS